MLLEELSNAFGPSGCEDEVRRLLARALADKVDELITDALGNLIAFKRGVGPEPRLRVMVDAHTDEVGLMITRIDKSGLLGFRPVGGLDVPAASGQAGPSGVGSGCRVSSCRLRSI